ncbi:MAG: hypothetical protein ABOK23_09105 [Candidatus Methanoperedens sp.]|nr:hypothetical protein [Candidatus Methanoperedens sp.]MCZ7394287.1 hypothetical protein [Candidatus Methanoperedens sp.]
MSENEPQMHAPSRASEGASTSTVAPVGVARTYCFAIRGVTCLCKAAGITPINADFLI